VTAQLEDQAVGGTCSGPWSTTRAQVATQYANVPSSWGSTILRSRGSSKEACMPAQNGARVLLMNADRAVPASTFVSGYPTRLA
jgi:hypothetical protein